MHGTDDESHDALAGSIRAAAEAGRARTAPVDVAAALTEGSKRRHARRRRGQVFGSTLVAVLTAAILVPALALRSPQTGAVHGLRPTATVASRGISKGSTPSVPSSCKGRWLRISMAQVAPYPKNGLEPPVTLHEVVTVRSTHRCMLSGFLELRSVRQQGTPYAAVKQTDVGPASTVVVRPGSVAVAKLTLRVPWYLPSGNLCASGVTIGIVAPGSHRVFHGQISSGCGTGSLGTLRAKVGSLRSVSSSLGG